MKIGEKIKRLRLERQMIKDVAGTDRNRFSRNAAAPLPANRPEQLDERLLAGRNELPFTPADFEMADRTRIERQRDIRQLLRIRPVDDQYFRLFVTNSHICPQSTVTAPTIQLPSGAFTGII